MLLGNKLIFVISQPRAGSTMLQRILGCHPDIHTVSEPWIMLHPSYATRSVGHMADYNAQWAHGATQTFFESLSGGHDEYFQGVRRMYSYIYSRALEESGKKYFLDKTPRYYFIIPELCKVFPEARFIILLRNPLSVLNSILNTWVGQHWLSLHNYKHDLVDAPLLLLEGSRTLNGVAIKFNYESIVDNPKFHIEAMCEYIGVDFSLDMINYGSHGMPEWQLGDQANVYQHSKPVAQSKSRWMKRVDNPQVWRLMNDYLEFLGEDIFNQMGYSYDDSKKFLFESKPSRLDLISTISLSRLLEKPIEERSFSNRHSIMLQQSIKKHGISKTMLYYARKLKRLT